MSEIKGRVFDIQRFSIHDGPGIRTTVFMKGCPLKCCWCHNPESQTPGAQLSFLPDKCIGCGYCYRTCPQGCHATADGHHVLDRGKCVSCGACAAECYAGALELVGRDATAGEVIEEVLRDKPFYETSHGGMTLSGGEPLYQIDFSEALLMAAKRAGLHCCMETCGYAPFGHFERVLPMVDLFLYDIKETDGVRHSEYSGAPLEPILENLRRLSGEGAAIRLRLPIIPGYNDRPDHFEKVAGLARELPRLEGAELLPYHALADSKIARLGMSRDSRAQVALPAQAQIDGWIDEFERLGLRLLNHRAGK